MSDSILTRRSVLAGMAAGAAALSLPRSARAGDDGVVNVVHPYPEDSPVGSFLDRWKKGVMADNNGRFKMKFREGEDTGAEATVVQNLRKGKFEAAVVSSYGLGTEISKLNVLSLPYLFGVGDQSVVEARLKDARSEIKSTLDGKGLKLVWMFYMGRQVLVSRDLELGPPSSYRGVKVGVRPGAHEVETWKAIGARPVEMAVNEMDNALRTNRIQAAAVSLFEAADLNWSMAKPRLALTNHAVNVGFLVFNKERFDKMAKKDQAALFDDRGRRQEALSEMVRKREAGLMGDLNREEMWMNVVKERDLNLLQAASAQVHTDWLANHAGAKGLHKTLKG